MPGHGGQRTAAQKTVKQAVAFLPQRERAPIPSVAPSGTSSVRAVRGAHVGGRWCNHEKTDYWLTYAQQSAVQKNELKKGDNLGGEEGRVK